MNITALLAFWTLVKFAMTALKGIIHRLWTGPLTSVLLWHWWRCRKIEACSSVSGLIFWWGVSWKTSVYFDEILVMLMGKTRWERNRDGPWGWNSCRWCLSYHVYCSRCLAAWMLGLNRAGLDSLSVKPNAVCWGPSEPPGMAVQLFISILMLEISDRVDFGIPFTWKLTLRVFSKRTTVGQLEFLLLSFD